MEIGLFVSCKFTHNLVIAYSMIVILFLFIDSQLLTVFKVPMT